MKNWFWYKENQFLEPEPLNLCDWVIKKLNNNRQTEIRTVLSFISSFNPQITYFTNLNGLFWIRIRYGTVEYLIIIYPVNIIMCRRHPVNILCLNLNLETCSLRSNGSLLRSKYLQEIFFCKRCHSLVINPVSWVLLQT